MPVLIDSSVWIAYFRHGDDALDFLIDENLIAVNDIILTELIPVLRIQNQRKLVALSFHFHMESAFCRHSERRNPEKDWIATARYCRAL